MNIFFLGAGYSRPAGLPLGDTLFSEVLKAAKSMGLYKGELEYDIYEYLEYHYAKTGKEITEHEINIEDFISYLDIDNHLLLKGGDTSSGRENIKILISYVLYSHESKITNECFKLYEQFAEHLGPYDVVFTFNYDTIIEKTFARKNISYRLYPVRQKYDRETNSLILDWKDEIAIFKMHGSINWFDITHYQKTKDWWERLGDFKTPPYAVFGKLGNKIRRLLDEPFKPDDPFRNIYVLDDLEEYFDKCFNKNEFSLTDAPFIIPPSYQKLVYIDLLSNFWYRFTNVINRANKLVIIGFSLPAHDEYIRQPMYWYIKNFHEHGQPLEGKKSRLKIIDYKKNQKDIEDFKKNYRFVDETMTDFYFGGFCEEALDIIFSDE